MSELEQEVARLRAENERLRQEQTQPRYDEQKTRMDSGLSRLAAHANREAQSYRLIQAQGLEANVGEVTLLARDAAEAVMHDMGLI